MTPLESKRADWQDWLDRNRKSDAYSAATVNYAERWADKMEAALAAGESLEQCWETLSFEASDEEEGGVTGFMYGTAVGALAECWVHGEALRKLHNARWGVGPEAEGTVNPAILTIEVAE